MQDNELVALLSKNDVCGASTWKDSKIGKSVVDVCALTYCDIHTINVDDLKKVGPIFMRSKSSLIIQVLDFYQPFSHTFSRNLTLSFDLARRIVFSKVRK